VGLLRAIHHEDRRRAITAWRLATGAGSAGEFDLELRLCNVEAHAWRWFYCRAAPIRDAQGRLTSWAGVALDFHDLRQAREALAEQSERLRVTYQSAPIGLCLLDPDLRFLAINAVLAEATGASADAHLGRTLHEMAPQPALILEQPLRRLFETGEAVKEIEVEGPPVSPPALRRVWLNSFLPVRNAAGAIVAATGSVLDITARKHAEMTERLLSREVDHRAKNVLAVVRSMVRVSAAEAGDDVAIFVDVLEGRIAAMARVHTLLSRAGWNSVELGELVHQEAGAFPAQIRSEGATVALVAQAAQPLTMVLHELVTNAAKYGALSLPTGTVKLRWARDADGVKLEWLERGGPAVDGPPALTGFGTELIDGNASTPLDGGLERSWEPEGLRCTLRIGPGALVAPDHAA
jgi:PAS domain S-box-containing protein